jgi:8-oxo-dGTP pyrophosphatase MutT (NUDIX family)
MNKLTNVCNNCGKVGHLFHQCKLPITSYGIILFRYHSSELQFLMIRRKDSFGYIDFIRGKYSQHNIAQVVDLVNEMSVEEKQRILTMSFDVLSREMWGTSGSSSGQCRNEDLSSKKKFDSLKEGISIEDNLITLQTIVDMSTMNWTETEWEFPKGRRNQNEKDLECALREFEEETGILSHNIKVIENIFPFEETFIGSNLRPYKHKYFLAYINNDEDSIPDDIFLKHYQQSEVSKLEWKNVENCLESIRPYNLEKKELIININNMLEEYKVYS